MSLELVKKDIEGKLYEFEQFGAKKSLATLIRLMKLVGKPLALMFGSIKSGEKLLDMDMKSEMISAALAALTENMDSSEVISLMEELCATKCLCDGKKINFDSHFEGKLPHLFKVLWAALEVQYGNFFDAIGGLQGLSSKPTTTQAAQT